MSTIPIAPAVALQEAQALVEYYRNRALLLAQALAETRARVATLEAELAARADPDATETSEVMQ